MSHPHVKEAAVIGAPVGVNGEVPVAYVITSTPVSEDTLINFVNGRNIAFLGVRGQYMMVFNVLYSLYCIFSCKAGEFETLL